MPVWWCKYHNRIRVIPFSRFSHAVGEDNHTGLVFVITFRKSIHYPLKRNFNATDVSFRLASRNKITGMLVICLCQQGFYNIRLSTGHRKRQNVYRLQPLLAVVSTCTSEIGRSWSETIPWSVPLNPHRVACDIGTSINERKGRNCQSRGIEISTAVRVQNRNSVYVLSLYSGRSFSHDAMADSNVAREYKIYKSFHVGYLHSVYLMILWSYSVDGKSQNVITFRWWHRCSKVSTYLPSTYRWKHLSLAIEFTTVQFHYLFLRIFKRCKTGV